MDITKIYQLNNPIFSSFLVPIWFLVAKTKGEILKQLLYPYNVLCHNII